MNFEKKVPMFCRVQKTTKIWDPSSLQKQKQNFFNIMYKICINIIFKNYSDFFHIIPIKKIIKVADNL